MIGNLSEKTRENLLRRAADAGSLQLIDAAPLPLEGTHGEDIMKTIIAMTAAALLALAAGQAAAQDEQTAPKASVSYADLDLSHPAGRSVLERRISIAVARVCPSDAYPGELRDHLAARTCKKTAWAGANQQLAAIYDGRKFADSAIRVAGAK